MADQGGEAVHGSVAANHEGQVDSGQALALVGPMSPKDLYGQALDDASLFQLPRSVFYLKARLDFCRTLSEGSLKPWWYS